MVGRLTTSVGRDDDPGFPARPTCRPSSPFLPVAAIEQHGHTCRSRSTPPSIAACWRRAMELCRPICPVTVLLPCRSASRTSHIAYPGTLTLSAETLIRLWTEIERVARAGVPQARAVQRHGGQPADRRYRRRELPRALRHVRGDLQHLCLCRPPGLFPDSELKHGIHGGSVETRS